MPKAVSPALAPGGWRLEICGGGLKYVGRTREARGTQCDLQLLPVHGT